MTLDLRRLDELPRAELIALATQYGIERPERMTRVELKDELVRVSITDEALRERSRGWLGVARDLVASVVEAGLHMPDAAKVIRGDVQRIDASPRRPPVATVTLAEIYAAQGHARRALKMLEQVLEKEPDHEVARALKEQLLAQGVSDSPREQGASLERAALGARLNLVDGATGVPTQRSGATAGWRSDAGGDPAPYRVSDTEPPLSEMPPLSESPPLSVARPLSESPPLSEMPPLSEAQALSESPPEIPPVSEPPSLVAAMPEASVPVTPLSEAPPAPRTDETLEALPFEPPPFEPPPFEPVPAVAAVAEAVAPPALIAPIAAEGALAPDAGSAEEATWPAEVVWTPEAVPASAELWAPEEPAADLEVPALADVPANGDLPASADRPTSAAMPASATLLPLAARAWVVVLRRDGEPCVVWHLDRELFDFYRVSHADAVIELRVVGVVSSWDGVERHELDLPVEAASGRQALPSLAGTPWIRAALGVRVSGGAAASKSFRPLVVGIEALGDGVTFRPYGVTAQFAQRALEDARSTPHS